MYVPSAKQYSEITRYQALSASRTHSSKYFILYSNFKCVLQL